ncbi:hypothetical protein [Pantoea sp. 1.19]|uniref:hypothetical protein n=1 Tax=Pantoea sp. 1.19 TaxID=1925589 RepID=UPI001115410C|nr:hypothetical protein [Pantoea sp. 1.19]
MILNVCLTTGLPVLSGDACSDPATQQEFDLFNKATRRPKHAPPIIKALIDAGTGQGRDLRAAERHVVGTRSASFNAPPIAWSTGQQSPHHRQQKKVAQRRIPLCGLVMRT